MKDLHAKKEDHRLIINLKRHVFMLSHDIGDRNVFKHDKLLEAEKYIIDQFRSFGYRPEFQKYTIMHKPVKNIVVTKTGVKHPDRVIVVGAHYDSYFNPGADDNASGIAGVLELARFMADKYPPCTIKFVTFPAEEPPFFETESMGSWVFAKAARAEKLDIKSVLILEMIGYFKNRARTQRFPSFFGMFYPHRGNFIAVLGNIPSTGLVFRIVSTFGSVSRFPIKPMVVWNTASAVHFSDHWAFWKEKFPAVMITDTSFYRNHYYHTESDTYEKLDYVSMAEVVKGLGRTLLEMIK